MRNIFIFHGTGGYPTENWFPWLKEELQQKNCNVIIPQFPTPDGQSLEAWLKVLDGYKDEINEDTILIGHSLGGLFLLRVLEQLNHKVHAAIFVAAPIGVQQIKFYDSDFAFSGFSFDWNTIKKNAEHVLVYHSDNDPYVSLGNGKELAKQLGVDLQFIPNKGHFNISSDPSNKTFEKLLEDMQPFLK